MRFDGVGQSYGARAGRDPNYRCQFRRSRRWPVEVWCALQSLEGGDGGGRGDGGAKGAGQEGASQGAAKGAARAQPKARPPQLAGSAPRFMGCLEGVVMCPAHYEAGKKAGPHFFGENMGCGSCAHTCEICLESPPDKRRKIEEWWPAW